MTSGSTAVWPAAGAGPAAGNARGLALRGWRAMERFVDGLSGAANNPLRCLGAIGFGLFWLLALSGIYLYAVLDTSAGGAYASIDRLSREQRWLGGVLRSVHRYAADAFVVVMLAHLLREWLFGHFRGFRRFSWLTGLPLLAFATLSAVGGFWLNWDQLGRFSAQASAELLDWWPFFGSPLTRNFLSGAAVSDRLFSLFVFVHLGVPLLLLFGMWFHIQRISHAAVFPPRRLAAGLLITLLLLALARPVHSGAPAELSSASALANYDWLLLAIHPLQYATSAGFVWALLGAALLLLVALPFLPQGAARMPVAVVDAANCSGCRRCFDDCPYAAITMRAHPNGRIGRQIAQVDAELCAACGICVGACPSATPFRSLAELVSGIDMPNAPIADLRQRLRSGLAKAGETPTIVAFGCERGACVDSLAGAGVLPLGVMCIGALPPSFVEYALRDGAAGVLVSGCRGCEFRLGAQWTEARLLGVREPHLRVSVPRRQLAVAWADAGEETRLREALHGLRERLDQPAPAQRSHAHV